MALEDQSVVSGGLRAGKVPHPACQAHSGGLQGASEGLPVVQADLRAAILAELEASGRQEDMNQVATAPNCRRSQERPTELPDLPRGRGGL